MKYLQGYPQSLQEQARALLQAGTLTTVLQRRYPQTNWDALRAAHCGAIRLGNGPAAHAVRTDGALYDYVTGLKNSFMRSAPPLSKIVFDNRLQVVAHALGTHSTVSRVQGGRLKAKREIRIAGMFRDTPEAFLRMITVHELAHLKEKNHDKAFYQLCCHMEPDYHQLEFDLRLYLTQLDHGGKPALPPDTTG